MSDLIRIAYRLDQCDVEHLLLGGDVRVCSEEIALVLSVDGMPVRDYGTIRNYQLLKDVGTRIGCVRKKTFNAESDGT